MTVTLRLAPGSLMRPARPRLRRRPGLWTRLFAPTVVDSTRRAGAEQPATPMLTSISLGGASRMR